MAPDRTTALDPADRAKLAAILARLASSYDGEVLAAAAALQRFLTSRNLTVSDVAPPRPAFDVLASWPLHWRDALRLCRSAPATMLSAWERQSLGNLAAYRHRPSGAQLDILATPNR